MKNINITIDGKEIKARGGQTVLEAALENGIYIPHLCHHPSLTPAGACRLCLVEMADGVLTTACRLPVIEGMAVKTRSKAVDAAVRPVVELLIQNHHATCRGCPATGKCELQTVMGHLKIDRRRVRRLRSPETTRPLDNVCSYFDYDPDRCILCGICIRSCEALHGSSLLFYTGRGFEMKVAYYGSPDMCQSCLKCIERCPVGAFIKKQTEDAKA